MCLNDELLLKLRVLVQLITNTSYIVPTKVLLSAVNMRLELSAAQKWKCKRISVFTCLAGCLGTYWAELEVHTGWATNNIFCPQCLSSKVTFDHVFTGSREHCCVTTITLTARPSRSDCCCDSIQVFASEETECSLFQCKMSMFLTHDTCWAETAKKLRPWL